MKRIQEKIVHDICQKIYKKGIIIMENLKEKLKKYLMN